MTAQMDTFKSENTSTTDLIGQNWQKLIDLIENRPDDNDVKSFDGGGMHQQYRTDENVLRTLQDVKRLRQKDMPLFGHCPETDEFYTVVCSKCSMILMPHALKEHYEKRHSESEKSFTNVDKQSIEMQNKAKAKKMASMKLDKSKKLKCELSDEILKESKKSEKGKRLKEADVARVKSKNGSRYNPEMQLALSPSAEDSIDGKEMSSRKRQKEKRRSERKTDKVFDPDKHCGVINDTGKPCVRSILCKVHQVALKRAVPNRSLTYDMLIRILKTHPDEEKTKIDNGLCRAMEKDGRQASNGGGGGGEKSKSWVAETANVKVEEEPPMKRLKIKEEESLMEEENDQTFTLPSHLEALIDETLRTLKDVEENQAVTMPTPPKSEPIIKWNFDSGRYKESSPPPSSQTLLDDIPWHSTHPKPLASNTFGCRLIGGLMSTCKKLDTLRKHLQSVWTVSSTGSQCFNDTYNQSNKPNGCTGNANLKNNFNYAKYMKKANMTTTATTTTATATTITTTNQIGKKTVPSPVLKGTPAKRKRKITPAQSTSTPSEIISGLLISNPVPMQRAAAAAPVPTIPTGVIPVNSITGNGVPLRLFQGSLPVIASTAPNQSTTFIQLNLCPK